KDFLAVHAAIMQSGLWVDTGRKEDTLHLAGLNIEYGQVAADTVERDGQKILRLGVFNGAMNCLDPIITFYGEPSLRGEISLCEAKKIVRATRQIYRIG